MVAKLWTKRGSQRLRMANWRTLWIANWRSRIRPSIRGHWIRTAEWRYTVALLLALAGCVTRVLLYPLLGRDTPIMISIIAVSLAAWMAGFGPGVLATLVSLLGGVALLVPPWGAESGLSLSQVIRLLLFLLTGLIVSGLTEALYQTTYAWIRAEQEQENRVLQERNRMAREIHDTLAQGLTGIIIQLEAAEDTMTESPADAHAHIARAQNLARHSLTEARRSVQALRPQMLEETDLAGALSHYAEQMTAGSGVTVEVNSRGVPPAFLSPEMQSNLLRIGIEALTNSLKHARADAVQILLIFDENEVCLSVKDNGRGFVPHAPQAGAGFGLTGMWERAERIGGQFNLISLRGEGTEVKVTVSLPVVKNPVKWGFL